MTDQEKELDGVVALSDERRITEICLEHDFTNTLELIRKASIIPIHIPPLLPSSYKTVRLLCNWCDANTLYVHWNKFTQGRFTWGKLQLVCYDEADFYVIINKPRDGEYFVPERTFIFHMEPNMTLNPGWEEFGNPDKSKKYKFLDWFMHRDTYNNMEWHLSKTYTQLSTDEIVKHKSFSTVVSDKRSDPGQIKRLEFIEYMKERDIDLDIYGKNTLSGNIGSLPDYQKDEAMFPYKYAFTAENHAIPNYITEKLVDAILAECLCFYWGAPNASDILDSRAYVQLSLDDFEQDHQTICDAIQGDLWAERIEFIRKEKYKILNELQFFPRLHKIIFGSNNK